MPEGLKPAAQCVKIKPEIVISLTTRMSWSGGIEDLRIALTGFAAILPGAHLVEGTRSLESDCFAFEVGLMGIASGQCVEVSKMLPFCLV